MVRRAPPQPTAPSMQLLRCPVPITEVKLTCFEVDPRLRLVGRHAPRTVVVEHTQNPGREREDKPSFSTRVRA